MAREVIGSLIQHYSERKEEEDRELTALKSRIQEIVFSSKEKDKKALSRLQSYNLSHLMRYLDHYHPEYALSYFPLINIPDAGILVFGGIFRMGFVVFSQTPKDYELLHLASIRVDVGDLFYRILSVPPSLCLKPEILDEVRIVCQKHNIAGIRKDPATAGNRPALFLLTSPKVPGHSNNVCPEPYQHLVARASKPPNIFDDYFGRYYSKMFFQKFSFG